MRKKLRIIFGVIGVIILVLGIFVYMNWNKGLNIEGTFFINKRISDSTKIVAKGEGDTLEFEGAIPIIKDYDSSGEGVRVIPDRYNTGADLTKEMKSADSLQKGGYLEKRDQDYVIKLQDEIYNQDHIVFENIYFEDLQVFFANNNDVSPNGTIEFINCYFSNGIKLSVDMQKKLIFRNCDFLKSPILAVNSEFYSCKFYESYADALQIAFNVTVHDSYIFDNGYGDPEKDHSDGIQIAGFGNVDAHDIDIDNVRIEMVRTTPKFGQNSAMIIKMDLANGYDMSFTNMILNGGAFALYVIPNDYTLNNLKFENIAFGRSSLYGPLYGNQSTGQTDGFSGMESINNDYQTQTYISSVRKENGKIIFCATNETEQSRTIRVETDKGEQTFEVPAVLTVEEAMAANATYYDYNIDLEMEVEDASWIKIYDQDNLIRYKDFSNEG